LGTFTSTLMPEASLVCRITFRLPPGMPTTLATDVRQLLLAFINASAEMDWARPGATMPVAASAMAALAMKHEQCVMAFCVQADETLILHHNVSIPEPEELPVAKKTHQEVRSSDRLASLRMVVVCGIVRYLACRPN